MIHTKEKRLIAPNRANNPHSSAEDKRTKLAHSVSSTVRQHARMNPTVTERLKEEARIATKRNQVSRTHHQTQTQQPKRCKSEREGNGHNIHRIMANDHCSINSRSNRSPRAMQMRIKTKTIKPSEYQTTTTTAVNITIRSKKYDNAGSTSIRFCGLAYAHR